MNDIRDEKSDLSKPDSAAIDIEEYDMLMEKVDAVLLKYDEKEKNYLTDSKVYQQLKDEKLADKKREMKQERNANLRYGIGIGVLTNIITGFLLLSMNSVPGLVVIFVAMVLGLLILLPISELNKKAKIRFKKGKSVSNEKEISAVSETKGGIEENKGDVD